MLILGIDPALTTGLALRETDFSGNKRIRARAEEYKITRAEDAEIAFVSFMNVEPNPDLIVIERMFVGASREGSISLADMAGWFEMLCAHYYPGVKRLRPFAKQWRASVEIESKSWKARDGKQQKGASAKNQAVLLATSHGLDIPVTYKDNEPVTGHNAAEAYCMTYYDPKPGYHYRGKGADGRKR